MADHEIRRLLYDELTALPNRVLLQERIEYEIESADRKTQPLALVHIDPFPFSDINSMLGFDVGDALLVQCADRLSKAVRKVDTVAKLNGDEFALLLVDVEQEGVMNVCQKLLTCFDEPFDIGEEALFLGLNMGISIYPLHCATAGNLMRSAMVAAREAKKRKETTFIYRGSMASQASENLKLFGTLRKAIRMGTLNLNFQPQIDIKSRKLSGLEVLSRWNEMDVSPGRFIPVAEATGLIRDLTHWMVQASLTQAAAWKAEGHIFPISMNVSVRDLLSSNLVNEIQTWLRQYQLEGYPLMIEVTESAVMEHCQAAIEALTSLRSAGLGVSIDDFGTGYSSLAYLKQLPANELKIDQSFVTGLASQPGNQKLVKAVISLAHEFDMKVVAEGIETKDEIDMLDGYSCDIGQGYHISRPLNGSDVIAWVQQSGCE